MKLFDKIMFFKKKSNKEEVKNVAKDPFEAQQYKNIIRLIYIAVESYNSYDSNRKVGITAHVSTPFALPVGMSLSDACKLISYLSSKVEQEQGIAEASMESVKAVESILPDYKFVSFKGFGDEPYCHATMLDNSWEIKIDSIGKELPYVADLITYCGKDFLRTNISKRYFNWYTENVTKEEIEAIYLRMGKIFQEKFESTKNSDC